MANLWDGKHVWIWELSACENGDVASIAQKLKGTGCRGVILKAHDGANVWDQFKASVAAFKAAGLIVGAWGYCYGDDPTGEAKAAHQAFFDGADWYVADAEIEYQNKQSSAVTFGKLLRNWLPDAVIGYSSFPFGNLHKEFPYQEFSSFCNVAVPQVYWNELEPTADGCIDQTMDWYQTFKLPVAPVGCAYSNPGGYVPQAEDYVLFQNACKKYGLTGCSWWSYQHATSEMWIAISRLGFDVSAAVAPEPPIANLDGVSDWAMSSVKKALKAGIITGDENGVRPQDSLTREAACVLLDRAGILDEVLKVKGLS